MLNLIFTSMKLFLKFWGGIYFWGKFCFAGVDRCCVLGGLCFLLFSTFSFIKNRICIMWHTLFLFLYTWIVYLCHVYFKATKRLLQAYYRNKFVGLYRNHLVCPFCRSILKQNLVWSITSVPVSQCLSLGTSLQVEA